MKIEFSAPLKTIYISSDEIRSHMQGHPSEPLIIICLRETYLSEVDPSDVQCVPIIELRRRQDVVFQKFDGDLDLLQNSSNIQCIRDS